MDHIQPEQLGVGGGEVAAFKQQRVQRIPQRGGAGIAAGGQRIGGRAAGAHHAVQNQARLRIKCSGQRLPQPRQQGIVRIHKQHPLGTAAAQCIQPRVARGGCPAVGLVQCGNAGVLGGKGITQRAGAVRAAVLHQHQLQIVRCTLQHAFNRLAQRVLGLIAGDHHPNGGQAHSVPSLCRTLR